MTMTEDELMAVVGRLYIGTLVRDRELARTRAALSEYENVARMRSDEPDAILEDSDGVVPAQD